MVSWELARRKKGVWKGEKVENEEAARDSLRQSDKQIIRLLGSGWEGGEGPALPAVVQSRPDAADTRALGETDKTLISRWAVSTEEEAVSNLLGIIDRNCLQSSLMGCQFSNNGLSN